MSKHITRRQYQEVLDSTILGIKEFHEMLERYTGIEARPYTAYLYYDELGDFIGDSEENGTEELLKAAGVEVVDA